MRLISLATLLGSLALSACGGGVSSSEPSGSGGGGGGAPGSGGGEGGSPIIDGDWQTLIEGTWQLPMGTEDYYCARRTVEEDVYIWAFRAVAPPGTHHTVLTRTDGSEPDGEFPCSVGTLSDQMIYASGVGTDDFGFPDGVAVRVEAGTQLLLNLHLFNSSTAPLDGTSGIQVLTRTAAEVEQEAEMVFAGSVAIFVPPQAEQTISGYCTFPGDATVVTVWPHMHQYGRHMKVVHETAAGEDVLHDGPFSFGEQLNYVIEPVTVKAGERVRVYCSYQNTTDQTLMWGDSSTDEMCFAGLYRYPALGDGLFCDLPL